MDMGFVDTIQLISLPAGDRWVLSREASAYPVDSQISRQWALWIGKIHI